jgi:K+-sensing histidine kinase KdpD
MLLENLLQWSQFQIKSQNIEKHPINICEVIQSVLEQTNYLIQSKNIKINIDCKQTDTLYINQNELEVIIRNLLTNALKFSPENGIIEIKSYKQNNKFIIEVADEGIGFVNNSTADSTNSIVTANGVKKKSKDRTGFGLIIVRDILNRNSGEINFKPNNSKGTIAQVIFNS